MEPEEGYPSRRARGWMALGTLRRSFAGYTRGIIIVAACSTSLCACSCSSSGSPCGAVVAHRLLRNLHPADRCSIAMFIAVIVAWPPRAQSSRWWCCWESRPRSAGGHVLQPLVMSKAVNIHPPSRFALSVAAGNGLGGTFSVQS